MRKSIMILAALALSVAVAACKKEESKSGEKSEPAGSEEQASEEEVAELTVDELAGLIEENAVAVFDSNGDRVREKYGKIPGAELLDDSASFDTSVLPEDKSSKVLFYCANTQCGASHESAERALAAGYEDVAILPAGIKGWKEAGQPTEKAL